MARACAVVKRRPRASPPAGPRRRGPHLCVCARARALPPSRRSPRPQTCRWRAPGGESEGGDGREACGPPPGAEAPAACARSLGQLQWRRATRGLPAPAAALQAPLSPAHPLDHAGDVVDEPPDGVEAGAAQQAAEHGEVRQEGGHALRGVEGGGGTVGRRGGGSPRTASGTDRAAAAAGRAPQPHLPPAPTYRAAARPA
jgi:hypothetical protein